MISPASSLARGVAPPIVSTRHVRAGRATLVDMSESQPPASVDGHPRPRPVGAAVGLYLMKILMMIIGVVGSIASIGPLLSSAGRASRKVLETRPTRGMSVGQLTAGTTAIIIGTAVFSVLFLIAYVVFVAFLARGANWARVVLLVLGCFAAVRLVATVIVGTGSVGVFASIGDLATIAAVILLYVPSSRKWFGDIRAGRTAGLGWAPPADSPVT
jgi:hypothetical protein